MESETCETTRDVITLEGTIKETSTSYSSNSSLNVILADSEGNLYPTYLNNENHSLLSSLESVLREYERKKMNVKVDVIKKDDDTYQAVSTYQVIEPAKPEKEKVELTMRQKAELATFYKMLEIYEFHTIKEYERPYFFHSSSIPEMAREIKEYTTKISVPKEIYMPAITRVMDASIRFGNGSFEALHLAKHFSPDSQDMYLPQKILDRNEFGDPRYKGDRPISQWGGLDGLVNHVKTDKLSQGILATLGSVLLISFTYLAINGVGSGSETNKVKQPARKPATIEQKVSPSDTPNVRLSTKINQMRKDQLTKDIDEVRKTSDTIYFNAKALNEQFDRKIRGHNDALANEELDDGGPRVEVTLRLGDIP